MVLGARYRTPAQSTRPLAAAGAQPGVYSLTLAGGAGKLLSTTEVVNPPTSAASTSYAFVVNLPSAGMYQLIATDFQFPTSLASLSATVAQNGTVLTQDSSGDFTGSAGEAVVVVNAQPPTSGNGVFAVTVQSVPAQTNGTATTYLDQTQAVGGTFTTQVVTVGASGGYVVTLNDLGFPSNFQNLAVILSQGSQVFGKIYNSGSFPVSVTPGTYVLTFVATPGAENYGLYAINIASQPPTVTFTAGITSVTAGQPVQLTWSSQNATSCTASGATNWTGTETLSGTTALVVNATETLTLTCAGPGGSTPESVSVTATAAPPTGKGGGGSLDIGLLAVLAVVFACRFQTRLRGRACA